MLFGSGVAVVYSQTSYGIPIITTTSVTSTSVPTVIQTPASMTTYQIENDAASANTIKIFPYRGTPPTAVPSPVAAYELAPGHTLTDAITCEATTCRNAMGTGWEAYLTASGSATVDSVYR